MTDEHAHRDSSTPDDRFSAENSGPGDSNDINSPVEGSNTANAYNTGETNTIGRANTMNDTNGINGTGDNSGFPGAPTDTNETDHTVSEHATSEATTEAISPGHPGKRVMRDLDGVTLTAGILALVVAGYLLLGGQGLTALWVLPPLVIAGGIIMLVVAVLPRRDR